MGKFIYSEWDGSQEIFDLDTDQIMEELGENVFRYGDLQQALRALQRHGLQGQNRQMPSMDRLLDRLRQMKRQQMSKYNLDSIMDDIKEKLDNILKTERQGIEKKVDEAQQKAAGAGEDLPEQVRKRLLDNVQERAAQNREKLDQLPADPAGQIKQLSDYDFMDEDARNQFKELMDMLKKQAMEQFGREMLDRLKSMDPQAMANMRNMIESLNQMLEQQMSGGQPDFQSFMDQFGDYFGDNPPQSLEELAQRLQDQIAQAQSLMDSLSPEVRQELQDLMDSMLDESTKYELAKMASYLERLMPNDFNQRRYPFTGEESLSHDEAMKLMESLQQMDNLEGQMQQARFDGSPEDIDGDLLRDVMGEEAEQELESLRQIAKMLEEAGYITKDGDRYDITPKGVRKIGQKALDNIFTHMKRDRPGGHDINKLGGGTQRIEETRKYEFGDDFHIHIQKTIMNSLMREPGTIPVKLTVEDFEVMRTEESTRSATVLILDQSLSMFMNGYFESAKQVAVAMDSLIKTRFPKDVLHILTFSRRAREIKSKDLLLMSAAHRGQGTNYQDALRLARKLLSRDSSNNKEIILVTDGEPTAHLEQGQVYFQYPPSMRTLQMTMREVRACTAQGITINTFMFESSPFFVSFVNQMARLNKGRVFFSTPGSLGKYILRDYLANKLVKIG